MNDTREEQPNWQSALGHHEALCSERNERIHKEIQSVQDKMKDMKEDIRELRAGQRWLIGVMLVWPPILIAILTLILKAGA